MGFPYKSLINWYVFLFNARSLVHPSQILVKQPVFWIRKKVHWQNNLYTPRKFKIAPENRSSERASSLFSVLQTKMYPWVLGERSNCTPKAFKVDDMVDRQSFSRCCQQYLACSRPRSRQSMTCSLRIASRSASHWIIRAQRMKAMTEAVAPKGNESCW